MSEVWCLFDKYRQVAESPLLHGSIRDFTLTTDPLSPEKRTDHGIHIVFEMQR